MIDKKDFKKLKEIEVLEHRLINILIGCGKSITYSKRKHNLYKVTFEIDGEEDFYVLRKTILEKSYKERIKGKYEEN